MTSSNIQHMSRTYITIVFVSSYNGNTAGHVEKYVFRAVAENHIFWRDWSISTLCYVYA